MGLFSWLLASNSMTDSVQSGQSRRRTARTKSASRFRPRVEYLEDRQLLTTLHVFLDFYNHGVSERRIRGAIETANNDHRIDVIELHQHNSSYDVVEMRNGPLRITSPMLKIVATHYQPDSFEEGPLRMEYTGDFQRGAPIFDIAEGSTVTLENLKISGGDVDSRYVDSAAISNNGALTITSCIISDNYRGIFNSGSLTVNSSNISDNSLGGIENDAREFASRTTMTINSSTISHNLSFGIFSYGTMTVNSSIISSNGDGIYSFGTVTVNASTIQGNRDAGIKSYGTATVNASTIQGNRGGGIKANGTLEVTGSYFIGNSTNFDGGGISNSGTATVNSSIFSGNLAGSHGGGIYSTGPLTVTASIVSDNFALDGAGIYSEGPLTVTASTFSSNVASYNGGGIYSANRTTLTASTLRDNLATNGGGNFNASGTLMVISSTLSGNSADYHGGGIANDDGTVSVISSTLSGNSAVYGGGIWDNTEPATLNNTIVANSPSGGDISGSITGARNLVEDGSGGLADTITGDPLLGPLADNGGPTMTHALLPGSPAINAGDNSLLPAGLITDQRGSGYPRVRGGTVDIGAFEVRGLPPTALDDAITTAEDTAVRVVVLNNDSDPDNDSLTVVAVTQPSHGTTAINPDGTVTYTPARNFNGADSFTYTISDGHEGTATATVSVTVTAVNDAPTLVLPEAQATAEDLAVRITGIAVADVDVNQGTGQVRVTLTVVSGMLVASMSAVGGLTAAQIVGNGTATVVLQGTIAAVNATLRAGISYLGNLNFHGNDVLSVTANDLGNFGAGGALTVTGSVAIHVASPAEQLDDLQDRVRVLRELGALNQDLARELLSKLYKANQAIVEGKTKVAYNLIGAFLNQVQDLIDRGLLTPAAAPLLTLARRLRLSLQIGGGF